MIFLRFLKYCCDYCFSKKLRLVLNSILVYMLCDNFKFPVIKGYRMFVQPFRLNLQVLFLHN
jgi:hypothetical protein